MTTQILIEFDPKDASPLDVVNALNKIMLEKIEKSEVQDYAISILHDIAFEIGTFSVLIATEDQPTTETP